MWRDSPLWWVEGGGIVSTGKYTKNAWDLFHSMFKDGEDIIIIDEWDRVFWGKILVHTKDPDLGFYLQRTHKKKRFFEWDQIRYMGQDGFPLRKLKGADGSDTIELEKSVEKEIRKQISKLQLRPPEIIVREPFLVKIKSSVFGDPFMIENCSAELFNPGNYGMQHYLEDEEECLVLKADNGAVAQLYNLPYIYHMEFAS